MKNIKNGLNEDELNPYTLDDEIKLTLEEIDKKKENKDTKNIELMYLYSYLYNLNWMKLNNILHKHGQERKD